MSKQIYGHEIETDCHLLQWYLLLLEVGTMCLFKYHLQHPEQQVGVFSRGRGKLRPPVQGGSLAQLRKRSEEDMVSDHGDPLQTWNATVTTLSHHAKDLWRSPRGTVIRIEVLVLLATGIFLVLAICGSDRRRRTNFFIQKGVFGAYTLSFSLAIYILGSMQSSEVKSSMYPLWAISLFVLDGCTDSITAYRLDDNTQHIRLIYQAYMYYGYLVLLIFTVFLVQGQSGLGPTIVFYLCAIAMFKILHRHAAHHLASASWNLNKMVADYMHEHKNGGFDPATMEGCHYLVDWPLSKSKSNAPSYATQLTARADEIIDIDKICRPNDMSLALESSFSEQLGLELKDTCLSFSLFHLLRRRYFGFACGEDQDWSPAFIFEGLLLKNEDGVADHNRVFKVIEVELAFMYDFFFTKYAAFYYRSCTATVWALVSFTFICVTIYLTAMDVMRPSSVKDKSVFTSTTTTDIVITLVILACTALLELVQLVLYWTSIWARVSFVCQHLRRSSCMMRFKEFLVKIGVDCASNRHCWKHKLEQFSLLESAGSYNPNSSNKLSKRARLNNHVYRAVYILDPLTVHDTSFVARKVRGKPGKPIELSAEVKKALVDSLQRTNGKLTNGKSSLVSNEADFLLWACARDQHSSNSSRSQRNESQTPLILTWHIATCYCEMASPCPNEGTKIKFHVDVATKLSKYCAHLVVSAPKLLPGHHYDTTRVFDAVAEEAVNFTQGSRDHYDEMGDPAEPEDTIFQRGIKLGKQLERIQDGARRWKVIADFWAEVMLYVAPSDNVNEHMERLAQGGEFITHLWALLSHAGVLERDQQDRNADNSAEQDSATHNAENPLQAGLPPHTPAPEIAALKERRIDLPIEA